MKKRSKQAGDENFPVAGLMISKPLRPVVSAYYQAARYCDDIADDPNLSSEEKLRRLQAVEDEFYGYASKKNPHLKFIRDLRRIFAGQNLDTSLFTDLLIAFRRDSSGYKYKTWAQLLDYCRYSAAPVGRFMLAIHDENPSTYLPSNIICAVLQIVNHIQDVKYDAKVQKRIYMPADIMEKFDVIPSDLMADKMSSRLRKMTNAILSDLQNMLYDARVLPSLIHSRRLRIQVCIIISLTKIMIKRLYNRDILQKNIKLSKIDWIRAIFAGLFNGIFTRTKITRTAAI